MAFRRISRQPGVTPKNTVRLRNYGAAGPALIVPVDVAALAGILPNERVDLMIDTDSAINKIAVVSNGEDIKVSTQRASGPVIVNASRMRDYIPRMRTTSVQYEVGEVDGRVALIVLVPKKSRASLDTKEGGGDAD
jgi:hypothetical protein